MVWGGQQVEAGKFLGYFDVMYTRGKMDPLGMLAEQFESEDGEHEASISNTSYLSLVAR